MDKEWMGKSCLSREHAEGVQSFLKFALQNGCHPEALSCPCGICGNLKTKNIEAVKADLDAYGMDQTYHTWIWHGERSLKRRTKDNCKVGGGGNNLFDEDHIDMVHAAYDHNADLDKFSELLEDAERPLYPGCVKFTKLSAIVKLYNLKAKFSWSDSSFNEFLRLIGDMLPDSNELPLSVYDAKKSLSVIGLNYQKFHACPNDCILYWKEYADLVNCPKCDKSRWKLARKSKVPAKVCWFFSPIARYRMMFRNKNISKELTWHAGKRIRDGHLRHPSDSPAWKVVDRMWPAFASETRNLRLAISADGINPHSSMNSTYSCWPVLMVTYNLPPWLCMKRRFMMLTLLISGPRQPGNDIDVYLQPLVDELKCLWDNGVEAFDAYRQEKFQLRAVLLWTINDFPAYGNMSGCIVKGYCACPICAERTYAKRLKHSRKICYTGHRQFLPKYHPYRKQKKAFDGTQEDVIAKRPLDGHEVLEKVKDIKCCWGKKNGKKQSKGDDNRCWKKKSIFFELEYWKDLHVRHCLDVMHIEKNVTESLIGTLLDIPGKTKDGLAARLDLVDMNVRPELAPMEVEKGFLLPAAGYTLSKDEKKQVCSALKGMKLPTGYSSNVSSLVSVDDLRLVGLKSHDYHTLMQQLLPVAIRGVLPKHVRYIITRLSFFFNQLCSKVVDVSKLDALETDIVITLCLLEKHFPPSFFDIMVHLMVHLVREVRLCGPVWYRWMYSFERFMRILKGYVRNRNRPEGCIAECYIAEEAVEFCSIHLSNVRTIGIPARHHETKLTKPLTASEVHSTNEEEWGQAHRYILANDAEIDPYIEKHMAHLKAINPRKAMGKKWLQDEHHRGFITWLSEHVADAINHSTHQIPQRVKWLAHGPKKRVLRYQSYMIDGVTYHTEERDSSSVVQNSGVSLLANVMQVSSAKDKNPTVSDMNFYGVIQEIWELDYHDFSIPVFKCRWVENNNGVKEDEFGFTLVNLKKIGYRSDPFILGSQAKQVFYIEDPQDNAWSVVLESPNRDKFEYIDADELGDVIIQHQCFTKEVPSMDLGESDEYEPPCVRDDCEQTLVHKMSS